MPSSRPRATGVAVAALGSSQVMVMAFSLAVTSLDAILAMHRLHPDLPAVPGSGDPLGDRYFSPTFFRGDGSSMFAWAFHFCSFEPLQGATMSLPTVVLPLKMSPAGRFLSSRSVGLRQLPLWSLMT